MQSLLMLKILLSRFDARTEKKKSFVTNMSRLQVDATLGMHVHRAHIANK